MVKSERCGDGKESGLFLFVWSRKLEEREREGGPSVAAACSVDWGVLEGGEPAVGEK
jgi:hypothetical protein